MLTVVEKVIFLQGVDVFGDIPTEQLSYVAAIAERPTVAKIPVTQMIVQMSASIFPRPRDVSINHPKATNAGTISQFAVRLMGSPPPRYRSV